MATPDAVAEERERLAVQAAAGDTAALDRLLASIRADVVRHCGRILPNPLDAEEAAQDVLVTVATRIDRFEGRSRFSTWLYRVTTNSTLDTYRKLKRRASTVDIDDLSLSTDRRTSVLAGNRIDLLEAVEQVDEKYAIAVLLRDIHDLDYPEIAEALDIAEGTVKSRIHEGRRRMRIHLDR
ncbi:MAG: RNA polymerase sigma factor [Actinomycetota bacterium]